MIDSPRAIVLAVLVLGCARPAPGILPTPSSHLWMSGIQGSIAPGRMRLYRTPGGGERVDSLLLVSPERMTVIYSLRIDSLRQGDALVVNGEMEGTNDCGYNVGLGSFIVLGPTDTSTTRSAQTTISHAAVFNISPNMHHGVASRAGALVITQAMSRGFVNFVGYAQSSVLTCRRIRVERGYGQLIVQHFTN